MSYRERIALQSTNIVPTIYNCTQPRIVGRTVLPPEHFEFFDSSTTIRNYLAAMGGTRPDYVSDKILKEVLGITGPRALDRVRMELRDNDLLEPVVPVENDPWLCEWRVRWSVLDVQNDSKLAYVIREETDPKEFEILTQMVMSKSGLMVPKRDVIKTTLYAASFGHYPNSFKVSDLSAATGIGVSISSKVVTVIANEKVISVAGEERFFVDEVMRGKLSAIHSRFSPEYFRQSA